MAQADPQILDGLTRGCRALRQALLAEEEQLQAGAGPFDADERANLFGVVRIGLTVHWQNAINARGSYMADGEQEHVQTCLANLDLGKELLGQLQREQDRTLLSDIEDDVRARARQVWGAALKIPGLAFDLIPGWAVAIAAILAAVWVYSKVVR